MINHSFRLTFFLCLVFLLLVIPKGFTQQTYTSVQLLQEEGEVSGNALMQENLTFLKETEQGMPFIEDMEVRTETDELDFSRQEYLFRMSFNNKQARKVQDQIIDNKIRLYELKSALLEESRLINRYELIADWYYAILELKYFTEKEVLLQDKKTVYQKMLSNALGVEIDNLLKIDEDIQDLERDVLQTDLQKDYFIQQLLPGKEAKAKIVLDTNAWISIATMKLVLDKVKDAPSYNIAQALQALEVGYEQLEYDMEKAESKRILDFVQVKYAGRNKLSVQKELSFGVGINIPTKSKARVKLSEAKMDIFDEQYKQELLQAEIEEEIAEDYARFERLLKEYELIQKQIAESQLEKLYEKYSSKGAVHPLTLLRMKETLLKNQRKLYEIEKDACFQFLDILSYKGLLSQTPATNYLSDGLESF